MKTILTILIFLITFSIYSQDTTVSKKILDRIFTQNAKGELFNWNKRDWDNSTIESHRLDYNVWQISNEDSAYYYSDTLIMYNYLYAYFDFKGNNIIKWIFHKKNKIEISEFNSNTAVSTVGFCCNNLKLKEKDGEVFIVIFHEKEIIDKFKVLDIRIETVKDNSEKLLYVMIIRRI